MKNIDNRYWIEIGVLTLVLTGLGWLAFAVVFPGQYPGILPVLLAVTVLITIIGQVVLTPLMHGKFAKFNAAFMIFKALKIMIILVFMIAYSLLNRDKALPFLISAFFLYLAYTIFESRSLHRHSKNQAER